MFGNLGEMAGLMKKFGEIQNNMKKMKADMAETTLTGKDPAEKVVIEMTGGLEVKAFHIDPAMLSSGNSLALETACAAAMQDILTQFKNLTSQKLSEATGGLSIPGMM